MVLEPFFISPFFKELVLPFVLVFTLVFAVLQKTKILGEGKKQIDAIIALVVGLILVAFELPRNIIINLMPLLAVALVIILVFMLIYGFAYGSKEGVTLHKWVKILFVSLFGLALVAVVLYAAGVWDEIFNFLFAREGVSQIWVNLLVIVVIAGAIIAVLGKKSTDGS